MKKIKATNYQFSVVIEKDKDGFFVADCPALQGCHTQGRTLEQAISNIRDAIKLNLKVLITKIIKKDLQLARGEFIKLLR